MLRYLVPAIAAGLMLWGLWLLLREAWKWSDELGPPHGGSDDEDIG